MNDADASATDADRGPPTDMPDQVPEFVGEIRSLINEKLAGDLADSLGEQISDLTSKNSENADADDTDEADA